MSLMTVISGTPNSGLEPKTEKEMFVQRRCRSWNFHLSLSRIYFFIVTFAEEGSHSRRVISAFPSGWSPPVLSQALNIDPIRLEGTRYGNLVNSPWPPVVLSGIQYCTWRFLALLTRSISNADFQALIENTNDNNWIKVRPRTYLNESTLDLCKFVTSKQWINDILK